MTVLNRFGWLPPFFLVSCLWGKTTTIKVFHVFNSFGVETQEIKNSIVMKYDKKGFLIDSTLYSHTLPLSEKYVYVVGPNEGLKLQRSYDREMVLSYRFKNDVGGHRVKTSLYGMGDTLYWKEFQKFDVKIIYFPYTRGTSSTLINKFLILQRDQLKREVVNV